jgi:hypothetical protein
MSDLGERWIAPYWQRILVPVQDPELEHYMTPAVAVVNPGPAAANVTVQFLTRDGKLWSATEQKIPPHQSWNEFGPDDKETTDLPGWVNVFSDQPVAPWGSTPDQSGDPTPVRVNMAFFRVDEIHVKELRPT